MELTERLGFAALGARFRFLADSDAGVMGEAQSNSAPLAKNCLKRRSFVAVYTVRKMHTSARADQYEDA
jgi:hypothetical protein